MTKPEIKYLDSCASTSTELLREGADTPHGTVLAAVEQTAGRGQRGNSWEAEPGKNLTFSMLLRPANIPAHRQFEMSMIVSLAITDVLAENLPKTDVRIKWPNDIYAGDRKICGILIENSVVGDTVDRAVVGVGINVNQTEFLSDAPNPVSMANILGTPVELQPLLDKVCSRILSMLDSYSSSDAEAEAISSRYHDLLWRGDGMYPFTDIRAGGEQYLGSIETVDPDGTIHIRTEAGELRSYLFKEVSFDL